MRQSLIQFILSRVVNLALSSFSSDDIKRYIDNQLDALEAHIIRTDTKLDDAFIPMINTLRSVFSIPNHVE